MNPLLDTVEPCAGAYKEYGQYKFVTMAYWNDADITQFYSHPKVESLLAECRKEARKEALLEAAEMCTAVADEKRNSLGIRSGADFCSDKLRRMAEGES